MSTKHLIGFLLLALCSQTFAVEHLREDTATQIALGPFVDGTDGVTAEEALTVTEWDCDLIKHADSGMATTALTITASAGSNDAAHVVSGMYSLELTATDTSTAGRLTIICDHATPATFVSVRQFYMVMPAQKYDSLYGTDVLQVDVTQVGGIAQTANDNGADLNSLITNVGTPTDFGSGVLSLAANLQDLADDGTAVYSRATDSLQAIRDRGDAAWVTGGGGACTADVGCVADGTAQSATATTLVMAAGETFADNELIGSTVLVASATTGAGQARVITGNVGSTDTVTVDTWTTTPTGTITYRVFGTPPGSTTSPAPVDVVMISGDATAANNLELATDGGSFNVGGGGIVAASVTGAVGSVTGAVGSVTGNVGGNVVGSVASVTGAVGSVTGAVGGNVAGSVGSVTGAVGSVTGNVGGTVNGLTSTAQGNVRTAVGLAAANIDTQLDAMPTAVENATEHLNRQRVLIGTCSSGSTTTCVDSALTQAAEAQLDDRLICFTDSWCALITGFTPGTDTVTTTKIAPSTRAALGYTIFPATVQ